MKGKEFNCKCKEFKVLDESKTKNAICEKCGKEMKNVKEGMADNCYDCENE